MNDNLIDITVKVPEGRLGEFYGLVGHWLSGNPVGVDEDLDASPTPMADWSNSADDLALAKVVWAKFSPRAQAMFSTLMERPGEKHSAASLAEELDIPNGMYGVAGVLAWPGRHCAAVGRNLPVKFEGGTKGEGASYWISQDVCDLFAQVK